MLFTSTMIAISTAEMDSLCPVPRTTDRVRSKGKCGLEMERKYIGWNLGWLRSVVDVGTEHQLLQLCLLFRSIVR